MPIFLGMECLACLPAVRRIACDVLLIEMLSLGDRNIFGISRTNRLCGGLYVCNFFSSRHSCLYFWVWKVWRACLPSVELPVTSC